ncbi:MAG TPA: DUF6174 domain-containing protein [Gemmatimonadaceae bacterium]|nr:DUF6174 domain-containing protein [Gemmatimonadaceae bacterium]
MKTLFVSAFLSLVIASACTSINDSATNTALLQLGTNRERWQSKGIHDYTFDYDFAAMIQTRPLHIEVRADTVNHVTDRVTGETLPNPGNPTVDSLFARVSSLIAHPSNGIRVQYNAALGFPESITSGSNVPDTGYTITVTNLASLP